jgi:hypothetical protein
VKFLWLLWVQLKADLRVSLWIVSYLMWWQLLFWLEAIRITQV